MSKPSTNIFDQSKGMAKNAIKALVKSRYFPEIWYLCEGWLQPLKGRKALVVGYGLGLIGEAMAKSGWSVTIVDSSVTALADLKGRFLKNKQQGSFQQAEPDQLPFEDRTYDAVLSVNMIEFTKRPIDAVHEIARVLVPGGNSVVATFNRFSPWGVSAVARLVHHQDAQISGHFFDRDGFETLLKSSPLVLDSIKDRACYLPISVGGFKFKSPVPGSFVALLQKPV